MWRVIKYLYDRKGIFLRIALPWLNFLRPGFHLWDHDNHQHLQRIDQLIAAGSMPRESLRAAHPYPLITALTRYALPGALSRASSCRCGSHRQPSTFLSKWL